MFLHLTKAIFAAFRKAKAPDRDHGDADAQLGRLKARIDADPDAFFQTTEKLRERDLALIGQLIQLYCYCDLNARRVIDALRHAALGPDKRNASRLPDADVFPHLRDAAALLPQGNSIREGLIRAADTIEIHRIHRHNFAHWAARKVANEEALILFSKNANEAVKRDGIAPDPDELKHALMPLASWSAEVEKLEAHTNYLAQVAADLEKNLDLFKARFAEEKERTRQEAIAAAKKAGAGKRAPAKT